MSNWAVGDLALFVRGTNCGGHTYFPDHRLVDGTIYRVSGVRHGPFRPIPGNACRAPCGLFLAERPNAASWCSECFRKILPDKDEPCETEFVTLLKRSKRTVTATASDWLLRAGPIARELNEQAKRDVNNGD